MATLDKEEVTSILKIFAKGLRKEKQLNILISKALDDFTFFFITRHHRSSLVFNYGIRMSWDALSLTVIKMNQDVA